MGKDRLEDFMNGFAAATQLLNRAGQDGFFVEYVCLATSVIDAMLRICLILEHQIKSQTKEYPDGLLFQTDKDKIISEREIYKRTLKEKIITRFLFAQLEQLYKRRNKIVHRYIISDITTRQVLEVGIAYEEMISAISNKTKELEARQIALGIGMVELDSETAESSVRSQIDEMAAKKHKDSALVQALKKKDGITH